MILEYFGKILKYFRKIFKYSFFPFKIWFFLNRKSQIFWLFFIRNKILKLLALLELRLFVLEFRPVVSTFSTNNCFGRKIILIVKSH